jgi:hypothetical protein
MELLHGQMKRFDASARRMSNYSKAESLGLRLGKNIFSPIHESPMTFPLVPRLLLPRRCCGWPFCGWWLIPVHDADVRRTIR